MKQFIKILLVAMVVFTSSCGKDWLDLESSTNIKTEGSLKTLKQFEFTMNGIYSLMQSSNSYSGRMVYYGDVIADDVQAYSSSKRTGNYYLLQYTAGNAPSTFWRTSFEIIRNCNLVISEIDAIEDEDTEYKNDLKGEALAIRALALFDLTRIYGQPYTMNNGSALGAPIITTITDVDSKPKRSTVAECYKAVIQDLEDAVNLLSGDYNKGKINKWGAMALLSRVYLYKGDDANALKTAEATIKGALAENYRLWTNAEYPTAWGWDNSDVDPGEVLFEIVNLTTDSPGKESMGYLCSVNGYKDMILTSSFYALLNKDPKDVRCKAYYISSKRAYINKYQPQQGKAIEDANIPLLRLSEVYLNAAEAAVKLNNNEKAIEYLNPIVVRANPANSVEGETITLERVLTERRKELYGEGHRAYDIFRNNLRVERIDVSVKAISSTKHLSQSAETKSFDRTYYKSILAIPKAEIDANSNIEQNPGY